MFENFPYTNFHDLNLNWIIQRIMEAYGPDNPPPVGLVLSVNGETGAVVTYKDHIVQLPEVTETLWNIFREIDGQYNGIQFNKNGPAQRIQGVNRYNIYDEGNPPPSAAVASVDGMTGAVKTWANTDQASLQTPEASVSNLWDLKRELTSGAEMGIEFEFDTVNQTYKAYLKYTPYGGSTTRTELLTNASLPPTGVASVNGQAGVVVLDGTDIAIESGSPDTIKDITDGLASAVSGKITEPATPGTTGQVLTIDGNGDPEWQTPSYSGSYNDLTDKPQINSVTLSGNKSLSDLGIQPKLQLIHTVTADGVKTYNELLTELYPYLAALSDLELLNAVIDSGNIHRFARKNGTSFFFTQCYNADQGGTHYIYVAEIVITNSNSSYLTVMQTGSSTAYQDNTNYVPASVDIKLYA